MLYSRVTVTLVDLWTGSPIVMLVLRLDFFGLSSS